jgi:hypothetical protein
MGLDGVRPSGGESSKRKGEGSLVRGGPIHAAQEAGQRSDRVGHHPLARSRAAESGVSSRGFSKRNLSSFSFSFRTMGCWC